VGDYSELADLSMTDDGDLIVDETGDLELSFGTDVLQDDVTVRLNTNEQEWFHHPWLGATLDDLLGEPNTRDTGKWGADKISDSLTEDGYIDSADLSVYTIPASKEEILYYIVIDCGEDEDFRIPFTWKFNK
jgi:hypothetical protein